MKRILFLFMLILILNPLSWAYEFDYPKDVFVLDEEKDFCLGLGQDPYLLKEHYEEAFESIELVVEYSNGAKVNKVLLSKFLKIEYSDYRGTKYNSDIRSIYVSGEGYKLLSGLEVGMSGDEIISLYGDPDSINVKDVIEFYRYTLELKELQHADELIHLKIGIAYGTVVSYLLYVDNGV